MKEQVPNAQLGNPGGWLCSLSPEWSINSALNLLSSSISLVVELSHLPSSSQLEWDSHPSCSLTTNTPQWLPLSRLHYVARSSALKASGEGKTTMIQIQVPVKSPINDYLHQRSSAGFDTEGRHLQLQSTLWSCCLLLPLPLTSDGTVMHRAGHAVGSHFGFSGFPKDTLACGGAERPDCQLCN